MTDLDPSQPGPASDGFDIAVERRTGGTLIRCTGELDIATAERLEAAIATADGPEVVIDCSELSFIDSTGVRTLLRAAVNLDKRSMRWSVVPGEALRRVTEVLGVGPAIGIEDASRDDAAPS